MKNNGNQFNNLEKRKYQVVFLNWFDRTKDHILFETDEDLEEAFKVRTKMDVLVRLGIRLNLDELIGRGIGIYFCEDKGLFEEEDDDEEDFNLRIKRGGKEHLFIINDIIEEFPLIEGEFTPGIYWEETGTQYFKINDLLGLSRLFSSYLMQILGIDEYKLICGEKKVEMQQLDNGSIAKEVKIFPLNFFEVYCPFCRQAVVRHELLSDEYPQCVQIETPCPHYIGQAVKTYEKYVLQSLDDLGVIYRIEENELYLETPTGWQKPTIHYIDYEPEKSFQGNFDEDYRHIFLFWE